MSKKYNRDYLENLEDWYDNRHDFDGTPNVNKEVGRFKSKKNKLNVNTVPVKKPIKFKPKKKVEVKQKKHTELNKPREIDELELASFRFIREFNITEGWTPIIKNGILYFCTDDEKKHRNLLNSILHEKEEDDIDNLDTSNCNDSWEDFF